MKAKLEETKEINQQEEIDEELKGFRVSIEVHAEL